MLPSKGEDGCPTDRDPDPFLEMLEHAVGDTLEREVPVANIPNFCSQLAAAVSQVISFAICALHMRVFTLRVFEECKRCLRQRCRIR